MYLEDSKPRVLCNGNGAISHLQTEMGNIPLLFAELKVHYSLQKRSKIPFTHQRLQMGQKMHVYRLGKRYLRSLTNPISVLKWGIPNGGLQGNLVDSYNLDTLTVFHEDYE